MLTFRQLLALQIDYVAGVIIQPELVPAEPIRGLENGASWRCLTEIAIFQEFSAPTSLLPAS